MKTVHADVAIIGSGPAGVAIAERLHQLAPSCSVVLIEKGRQILDRHFYDTDATIQERDEFKRQHQECPWLGDLSDGGALCPAVGGRGILGGAQLHRFYDEDLTAWPSGMWPVSSEALVPYFEMAERQLLGVTQSSGPSQSAALAYLKSMGACHPPYAKSGETKDAAANTGYPHRSSIERILTLVGNDGSNSTRILSATRAIRFEWGSSPHRDRAVALECLGVSGNTTTHIKVKANLFVLAASPVESTRIALLSGLGGEASPSLGRYLAEHMYVRGDLNVSDVPDLAGSINLFIPATATGTQHRYQLEVRSLGTNLDGQTVMRVMGSAAMDPSPDNLVSLHIFRRDQFGIPMAMTRLNRSSEDLRRLDAMRLTIENVGRRLGGSWVSPLENLPRGASYHEGGCMRIGHSGLSEFPADVHGRLTQTANVFVGDAAAFPTVGVANPILTLTAMGYRLAEHLSRLLK